MGSKQVTACMMQGWEVNPCWWVLQYSFGSAGNYVGSKRQDASIYATSETHSTLEARLIVLTYM